MNSYLERLRLRELQDKALSADSQTSRLPENPEDEPLNSQDESLECIPELRKLSRCE